MNLRIVLLGKEIVSITSSPATTPAVPAKEDDHLKEQERWEMWQRTKPNTGGQFGFGPRHYTIERGHTRWGG